MQRVSIESRAQNEHSGKPAVSAADTLYLTLSGLAGLVGALSFAVTIIALHLLRANVDLTRHYVSEFANGPLGVWFVFGAVAHGLGNVALGVGLRRSLAPNVLSTTGVLLFVVAAVGIITAALFPTDTGAPARTLVGVVHRVVVSVSFPVELIALFLFSAAFMTSSYWRTRATLSFAWVSVAALAVSWFFLAVFRNHLPGLAERAALGSLLLWEVFVAIELMRRRSVLSA